MKRGMPVPLLDRLTGRCVEPRLTREGYREAVLADIEDMLNTRRPYRSASDVEAPDYGLADWSAAPLDGRAVAQLVADALAAFEPRLSRVWVEPEPRGERLILRVEAQLAGERAAFLLGCDGGSFGLLPEGDV